VLALSPSLHSCVAGASEEGAIPVLHLGYQRLEEMSRGSSTHELARSQVAKGRLWLRIFNYWIFVDRDFKVPEFAEPDRAQKTCEVKMFFLFTLAYECCKFS
jgi:hypothetical protein